MDLQTRKLNAVEYLIHLKKEDVFRKIEETILKAKGPRKKSLKPFIEDQLIAKVEKTNSDDPTGKFKAQEQLGIESQKW